jgi:hypothetical protein
LLGSSLSNDASAQSGYYDRYDGNRLAPYGLEGRWVARRGYSLPASFGRGGRDLRGTALPPRMVIDERRNIVRVEDLSGRVIQRIAVGGNPRGEYIHGQWRNSKLVTFRTGYNNSRIIQTFSLTNGGRSLVVHTRQDAPGTRRDVEFTNVYRRA